MAKNSREGNRERAARRRGGLAARGLEQFQVVAPSEAKPLIRQAAGLMIRETDPIEPRSALRQVGGANEPDPDSELEAMRERVIAGQQAEIEALERQRKALAAERDAAGAAEAAALEDARLASEEVRKARDLGRKAMERAEAAHMRAEKAREQAAGALERAKKAEATVRRARMLPGLRGRLLRWIAGDALN